MWNLPEESEIDDSQYKIITITGQQQLGETQKWEKAVENNEKREQHIWTLNIKHRI